MICPRCKGKGQVRDHATQDEDFLVLGVTKLWRLAVSKVPCPICRGRGVIRDA